MTTALEIIDRQALIDEVLSAFAPSFGPAGAAYRGHVYRVYNVARRLFGSARRDDELAATSVFHDIGIWSDRTFDYIGPSMALANDYLKEREPKLSADLVTDAIRNHHVLLRIRGGAHAEAVEAFRRADLVDVSMAWYRAGLERRYLRELKSVFPYAGFHGVLVRTAWSWFLRHPSRPLPMLQLSASPERGDSPARASDP